METEQNREALACPFTGLLPGDCAVADPHVTDEHLAWHARNVLIPELARLTDARQVLAVTIEGDERTGTLRAELPEDGTELFLMVRAKAGCIEIRKCAADWWGANIYLTGE